MNSELIKRQIFSRPHSKLLTTKDAALYLGISPNALRIRVHRGEIKYFKLGSRLRFKIEDLDILLTPGNSNDD